MATDVLDDEDELTEDSPRNRRLARLAGMPDVGTNIDELQRARGDKGSAIPMSSGVVAPPQQGTPGHPAVGSGPDETHRGLEEDKASPSIVAAPGQTMSSVAPPNITMAPTYPEGGSPSSATGQIVPPMSPDKQRLSDLEAGQSGVSKMHGIGGGIVKGLDVAGSILAPRAMTYIPGSSLNYQHQLDVARQNVTQDTAQQQQEQQIADEQARAGLEQAQTGQFDMVPVQDPANPEQEPIMVQRKDAERMQAALSRTGAQKDIASGKNETATNIAAGHNATTEDVAGKKIASTTDIANANRDSREKVASLHEAQADFRARLVQAEKAAGGAAGGKLSAQNQARSEFAGTVTAQIPGLIEEVKGLKDMVGPGAGRWNDMWVNKAGFNDPKNSGAFAGLDNDLKLFASAVVVTHFGARGGGQHFIEAMIKNFSAAQTPEDFVARINSADKWLEGYAHMHGANTPAPQTPAKSDKDPFGIRQ